MKKIYLIAMLFLMGFAANAQRNIQLQVSVDTPVTAFNIITGSTVVPVYRVLNIGPDTLRSTDTLAFQHPGLDTNSIINIWATANIPAGSAVKMSGVSLTILQTPFAGIKTMFTATGAFARILPPYMNNTKYAWYGWVRGITPKSGTGTITFNAVGSIDTAHIWINKSTGVVEFTASEKAIQLFPNPAVSTINFDYTFTTNKSATVSIVDVAGRTVMSKDYENQSGTQRFTFDVASLQSGNYFLNFVVGGKTISNKFTVGK